MYVKHHVQEKTGFTVYLCQLRRRKEKNFKRGGTARPLHNHVQCGPLELQNQACMASNCNKVELIESFQNYRNRTRDI